MVVPDGVETAGQRDIPLDMQCGELQVYFLARPMSAKALEDWAEVKKPAGAADFSASVISDLAFL